MGVNQFLPTPSARRATQPAAASLCTHLISTHALREEGDPFQLLFVVPLLISTHALREEGDKPGRRMHPVYAVFLPTPSVRRATHRVHHPFGVPLISTHALREEGDAWAFPLGFPVK